MSGKILSSFTLGDMLVQYRLDEETQRVGFELLPAALAGAVVPARTSLTGSPEVGSLPEQWLSWTPGRKVFPLVQVKCAGDDYPEGYAQGRTMCNSGTALALAYEDQRVCESDEGTTITTTLRSPRGFLCEHVLTWCVDDPFVQIHTVFSNEGAERQTLEMISSFALGGITPFQHGDAPHCLFMHRLRSNWCAEGSLDSHAVESLGLQRSWSGLAALCHRFGQAGSLPVRDFFPFMAVEDRSAGVFWAAQLAWAGSWQMELYRKDDGLCLAGGLADWEFGHWAKWIEPGASFTTPVSYLSVAQGTLDGVCQRLTAAQKPALRHVPAIENELPVICDDFCTTWGKTSEEELLRIADRVRGTGVKYLLMDAGWYCDHDAEWGDSHGEWLPSEGIFPRGLASTTEAIRARGLIPGIWFEIETVGQKSRAYEENEDFLTRHGMTISAGKRRFWDLRKPAVVQRLSQTVIDLAKRCGVGYLKIDYNETIGVGVDGAESAGEGLRQHIEGVYALFDRIREALPDVVLEMCASGGHRLEPSLMARGSLASVSDAFELYELPLIAANLHRCVLPRQALIWVVVRKNQDERRMNYVLGAGFLGRICLGGEMADLDDQQWRHVTSTLELYKQVHPIIRDGVSQCFCEVGASWRHATGWQAVLRMLPDNSEAVVVIHTFADFEPGLVCVDLPDGDWTVVAALGCSCSDVQVEKARLGCALEGAYASRVIHLKARQGRNVDCREGLAPGFPA